jgi:hypothetical protein
MFHNDSERSVNSGLNQEEAEVNRMDCREQHREWCRVQRDQVQASASRSAHSGLSQAAQIFNLSYQAFSSGKRVSSGVEDSSV